MDKVLKFLEAGIVSLVAIFAPVHKLLLATGVMIFGDLITGILASRKRGAPITSAGLRRTLTKIVVYEAAICFAFIAEQYISDLLPFVKMASAMIAVVELKSIYENLNAASGMDLLKGMINKLGSVNDDYKFQKKIDDDQDK